MRKIGIVFLVLLMLICTGCKGKKDPDPTPVHPTGDADKLFEEYMEEEFTGFLSSSKLNAHFAYKNLSDYGLQDMKATLGEVSEDFDFAGYHDSLDGLHTISRDALSERNQKLYDRYESYLKTTLNFEGLENYEFYFSPNGTNVNLLTTFTEFVIRDEQDIKDMITYLNESEKYLKDAVEYTRKQAQSGIEQAASTMQGILDQVDRFLDSKGDNEVAFAINSQIDACDFLNDEQKESYKKQITEASDGPLMRGYEAIREYYQDRIGKTTSNGRFTSAEGKKYYEALLKQKTSSNMTPVEAKKLLMTALRKKLTALQKAASSVRDADAVYNPDFGYEEPEEILAFIRSKMDADFPAQADVTYSINYLDPSVASDSVAAYYLIPPLDDAVTGNVIKVNPGSNSPLYPVLAHEGYPGHCFQITYEYTNNRNPLLPIMDFIGYTEGWAMYVEALAIDYCDMKDAAAKEYIKIDNIFFYLVMGVVDIMVNYEDADMNAVADFIGNYYGRSYADVFYGAAIDDPGTYLPYSVGMAEVENLRAKAESALGNKFSAKEFHQALFDAGIGDFEYLEYWVDQYIKSKK